MPPKPEPELRPGNDPATVAYNARLLAQHGYPMPEAKAHALNHAGYRPPIQPSDSSGPPPSPSLPASPQK
jgi:hypothetical protein